jgi:hypothetical protein
VPQSILRFIRRSAEFLERKDVTRIQEELRGIYVLYDGYVERGKQRYDVRYIGMSAGNHLGIKGRLRSHIKSKRKGSEWTHFSIFQVWDNVTDQEIAELEGLARHIYRHDPTASTLNIQRGYKKLRGVRNNKVGRWE